MKLKLGVAVIGVTALALTACGSNEPAQAICMDPQKQERVDDDFCEEDEIDYMGFPFVFFLPGTNIPATGSKMPAGSYHNSPPKGYYASYDDYPARGGIYTGPVPEKKSSPTTKKKPPKTTTAKPLPKVNISKPTASKPTVKAPVVKKPTAKTSKPR